MVVIAAPGATDVYASIIGACETDVQLVIIDGNAILGTIPFMEALKADGEDLIVGDQQRRINYGQSDPEIVPITYAHAIQVLTEVLGQLPDIPKAPLQLVRASGSKSQFKPQHNWSLALDEQHETGFALRPMLPYNGMQTGPDTTRLALTAVAATPIGPVPLDKVSVPDDPNYAAKIKGQRNIPPAIVEGLKTFYS